MGGYYYSHRDQYRKRFAADVSRNVKAASLYLSGQVRASVSQPGTLRYNPTLKSGKSAKSFKTVYNFTHSRPGNPPYKQSGNLRMSIAYEVVNLIGRVGSNIKRPKYPLYLELGTKRMAARPYLRAALIRYGPQLRQILTRSVPAGGLPAITTYQFRSGHFGRGAAAIGWR